MSFSFRASKRFVSLAKFFLDIPIIPIGFSAIFVGLFYAWIIKIKRKNSKPRLLWGATPIKSLAYMARSLKEVGYVSDSVVIGISSIYAKKDFNYILAIKSGCGRIVDWVLTNLAAYLFFARALSYYDIFHFYFDGGILCRTLMARFELNILKLVGKKIVIMPYGSDAFVYDAIPRLIWRHVLLSHYPMHADHAAAIQKRVRRMTANADVVVGCLVHSINLPRWNILPLTCYPIDTKALQPIVPRTTGPIRIVHAVNHRGIKGTEFLEDAVERLRKENYDIELDVIEKTPNTEALQRMANADIYVDQLVFGYALAAIEGMALGKVVITAIENSPEYDLFRQYSYLNECPVVPATISNIYEVLKNLISKRDEWTAIGTASRKFVEKRHSYKACAEMFQAIYQKIWHGDDRIDLINFYHPLFEKKRLEQAKQL